MQNKNLYQLKDNVIGVGFRSNIKNESDKNFIIDNSSLTKAVLFVCDLCEGALVPSSLCTVCKKTATRICVKCGNTKKTNPHTICCDLILLGSMIKKDIHEKVDDA